MLNESQNSIARASVRVSQIIAAAMILGAAFFAGTTALMLVDWSELGGPVKLMSTLAAGSTIIFFGLAVMIPGMFPTQPDNVQPTDDPNIQSRAITEIGKLLTSQTVVRFALLEACVFANVLPLMFEPRWINLIAAAIGVLLMLVFFPTDSRQITKIENRFSDWISAVRR